MKNGIMFISIFIILMLSNVAFSQQNTDKRRVVAVEKFRSDTPTKYDRAITEKVIEIITKSKRFQVVDRTNLELLKKEQDLQRTAEFYDPKKQNDEPMLGADYQVNGIIRMINIVRMTSGGDFAGYRATLSFNLTISTVASGKTTEAQSFESKGASAQLTPERAVDEAIRTLEESMESYFQEEFPVVLSISRILKEDDDEAESVLISGGKTYGLKEGDEFLVKTFEMIDGSPYYKDIGILELTKIAGDNFSECEVDKGGKAIMEIVKQKREHIVERIK
jgi:Curli production assembly/transport component CsgG